MLQYLVMFKRLLASEFSAEYEALAKEAGVVRIKGSLDASSAETFHEAWTNLLEERPRQLLLDLFDVKYLSSNGLGEVLLFHKTCREREIGLWVYDCQVPVRRVFEISKLDFLILRPGALPQENPFRDYLRAAETDRRSLREQRENFLRKRTKAEMEARQIRPR